jgi:predicted aminopeptidase
VISVPRLKTIISLACLVSLSACYYVQATRGQMEVLSKREPIDEILASPETPEELSHKLGLVQEARQFSVDELGLPDNKSYRSYSDLERDFVVWNVFAAPEFSLDARQWCYPIVGCVSYRGYFSEDAAHKEAEKLSEMGFDVAVGGVPAYSTLGNFNDPVLNTMMRWDDVQLVSTLFHELAHQVLYIKNDTAFNESFATAVEEIGMQRWLATNGRERDMSRYLERKSLHRDFVDLVDEARDDLRDYYDRDIEAEEMRRLKATRLRRLSADVSRVLEVAGRADSHWLSSDLNNARLLPMALYEKYVPAFRGLYSRCDADLDCFYRRAEEISKLGEVERNAHLEALSQEESAGS